MVLTIFTIIGLVIFEVVCSIDNAIVNAKVLRTVSAKAKKWFLTWGLFFAVFVVRGLLPWIIVWAVNPHLGPIGALTASFSSDPMIAHSIEKSVPILFMTGGVFLLLLFFSWLFLENENYCIRGEYFFYRKGFWFNSIASLILLFLTFVTIKIDPNMTLGAAIGSTVFFITHGFRERAKSMEDGLTTSKHSDFSKLLFLEVLDTNFSIDGVLGAFAFTLSIPIILLGNGFGAVIVRQLTVGNIDRIKKYRYLENGAMYSIFFLGFFMIIESFGVPVPKFLPPIFTIGTISFFLYKSIVRLKLEQSTKP